MGPKRVRASSACPQGPEWWTGGKHGSLSPWTQAKVFALVTVSRQRSLGLSDTEIANEVFKVGGGHPGHTAIANLRGCFDSDPDWHPGKKACSGKRPGPPPLLTPQKKQALAKAAMALKRAGEEPTVAAVIQKAPRASLNPSTGEAFTDKYILQVFRTMCYDDDPSDPWDHQLPYQKTALPVELQQQRLAWARKMVGDGRTAGWYQQHCIWVDPCSTIIPGTARTAFQHGQARKGKGKAWISSGSKQYSRNLKAAPYATKQQQWGDKKAWWFIVLTRGKVNFVVMDQGWEQTGQGMATFVAKLPTVLDKMLGDQVKKPRVVFSDRGPGFYQASTGRIVHAYKDALDDNSFRPFAGDEAKWQPADLADMLMHETVAAWVRRYFRVHPHTKNADLDTNYKSFLKGMRDCEKYINENYDIWQLCGSMPARLQMLIDAKGDRLKY